MSTGNNPEESSKSPLIPPPITVEHRRTSQDATNAPSRSNNSNGQRPRLEGQATSSSNPQPRRSRNRRPQGPRNATGQTGQPPQSDSLEVPGYVSPKTERPNDRRPKRVLPPKASNEAPPSSNLPNQDREHRTHLPRFARATPESTELSPSAPQNPVRRKRGPKSRQYGVVDEPVRYSVDSQLANETKTDTRGSRRANQRIGRSRNGRPLGRYLMCVHKADDFVQIAVLEGRTLIEHYVSKVGQDPNAIDGNIYLGRVTNVLAGMEAAFVDIGTTKNAVLYRGDVRYDRDDLVEAPSREVRIEHLLRPRQVVLCQVTKNPIGTKGARLTQEVSLPGRFVVLVPNSESYGISKRLPDDERRRLRRILGELKPEGFGVIVRTAAEGASADELGRDISQLVEMWKAIEAKAKVAHAPTLLYSEPNVAVRVIREEFNRNYRGVIIDDADIYDEVHSYVGSISPELADRVEYYDPAEAGLPLFEVHHVHEQLHKAMDRKVWLPSGGYLIIDRAEALTVVDVNTGKHVGTVSLEETIHQTNVEAADEIARQLRLRDIGGIIIIDFIDMTVEVNKEDVLRALKGSLSRDKTKTQVYDISSLGLVEMTRQRVSEGLVEALSDACPTCKGRGMVFLDVEVL